MTDHTRQASLRVEILRICLEVLGKGVDSLGQDGYLNLRRTGVALIDLVGLNEGGLGFFRDHFFDNPG